MDNRTIRLVSLILAVALLPVTVFAGKPLDPHKILLPIYLLPDNAAADGKLEEWAGVPAVGSGNVKFATRNTTITPSKGFAPSLRCGMKKGSDDLYFLVVVRDHQQYAEAGQHWLEGDYLELYFDFGREAREKDEPEWYKKSVGKPPGMGQFGFRPRTLQIGPKILYTGGSNKWKVDYASALVEGGIAYEVRLDVASVLKDIKLDEMPSYIGMDLGFMDQDYMVRLQTAGWGNDNDIYRLFGDAMDHAWPNKYGKLSTHPTIARPEERVDPLPSTLRALFGDTPSRQDIEKAIGRMPDARLADLVTWAGCGLPDCEEVIFDADLVKQLMESGSTDVREKCMAVLYFSDQEKDATKVAVDAVYAGKIEDESPYVLTLANVLNAKSAFGYRAPLRKLAVHDDSTVAVTAAQALANVGTAADTPFLKKISQDLSDKLQDQTVRRSQEERNYLSACKFYFGIAVETLAARTEPITIPEFTAVRRVLAENTDLKRFIPVDGNNVYNAKGLLHSWPKEGPKELWRREVGTGKSCVVEKDGRAFTAAIIDGTQWAICLEPATGKPLWKKIIAGEEGGDKPIASPVIDGDRVYFVPNKGGQEQGLTIVCLRTTDGEELWRGEGDLESVESCATPLVVGDVIYCPLYSGRNEPFPPLAAVDKITGEVLWTAPPTGRRGSGIASPTYQVIDGIPQVIFSVYGKPMNEVWGVHAETGELLWRYSPNARYGLIPTPVVVGSRVFICDGIPPFSACLQMYVKDDKLQARQVYRDETLQCNLYNTVPVFDGAVYGFSNSALQCTNFEDGELLWKQEGKVWASGQHLILADGLLFALTKFEVLMVEASKAGCKVLGRVEHGIELGYMQQPTIANGRLYIRGEDTVICYDLINAK